MEVIVIGAHPSESKIQNEINEVLKKYSPENVEIQFKMAMNDNEVLYSALIIIKDCR